MALVPQYADDLGGERLVEELQYGTAVVLVAGRDGALLDMRARPPSQLLHVADERLGAALPLCLLGAHRWSSTS